MSCNWETISDKYRYSEYDFARGWNLDSLDILIISYRELYSINKSTYSAVFVHDGMLILMLIQYEYAQKDKYTEGIL